MKKINLAVLVLFLGCSWAGADYVQTKPIPGTWNPVMEYRVKEAQSREAQSTRPDYESIFSSMTVEGWHCVEMSSVTYLDSDCHSKWIWAQTFHTTLEYRAPPSCEDKTEQHCLVEQGYRGDGVVIWRKP